MSHRSLFSSFFGQILEKFISKFSLFSCDAIPCVFPYIVLRPFLQLLRDFPSLGRYTCQPKGCCRVSAVVNRSSMWMRVAKRFNTDQQQPPSRRLQFYVQNKSNFCHVFWREMITCLAARPHFGGRDLGRPRAINNMFISRKLTNIVSISPRFQNLPCLLKTLIFARIFL